LVKAQLGAARTQMLRWQVVGQLESFIENRANDFRTMVMGSLFPDDVRHQLLVINRLHAWFGREPVVMRGSDQEIAPEIRALARSMMRAALRRHRRPTWDRLNPWVDRRGARLARVERADHAAYWLGLRVLEPEIDAKERPKRTQREVMLPVGSYSWHERRLDAGGVLAKTVQIIERDGRLLIGAVCDMDEAFAASRATYAPKRDEIALDFGLATMFATPDGDLLGRAWRAQLERHDRRIAGLARTLQRQGIRPNRSRRYRARVAAFRGFLRTEIGRVLHRFVAMRKPALIAIERLDFRAPGLSRRLNRLLVRMGHALIRAKLEDLKDRLGIAWREMNPAYSSQTCSSCGYVAKTNRQTQNRFACGDCGHKIHADVNAARNLESGRSAFDRAARSTKADALRLTVRRHLERTKTRARVSPAERLRRNGYYAPFLGAGSDGPPTRRTPPQDVVADVSAR
jgi:putative transposase